MALRLTSTKSESKTTGCKFLVYGRTGTQKTRLARTCPRPFIAFAEPGLLSLRNELKDIPAAEITCAADVPEFITLTQDKSFRAEFDTIYFDGLTEIAGLILADAMGKYKDKRLAWQDADMRVFGLIRRFRDLSDYHVVMTCKLQTYSSEDSITGVGPAMPGKQWGTQLPYLFDEVFQTDVIDDGTTKTPVLRTMTDGTFVAKDRSGSLSPIEVPNIINIIKKIEGK